MERYEVWKECQWLNPNGTPMFGDEYLKTFNRKWKAQLWIYWRNSISAGAYLMMWELVIRNGNAEQRPV